MSIKADTETYSPSEIPAMGNDLPLHNTEVSTKIEEGGKKQKQRLHSHLFNLLRIQPLTAPYTQIY